MGLEDKAKSGAKIGGAGVGSAIGSIFNNPGVLILGALAIGLFIFKDRITEGIGNFKLPSLDLPTINLPQINFPEFKFPDFKFPDFDFKFPDFEFPDIAGGFSNIGEQIAKGFDDLQKNIPSLFIEEPGASTVPDPLDQNLSPGLAGGIQQRQRDLRDSLADDKPEKQLPPAPLIDAAGNIVNQPLTPAQLFSFNRTGILPEAFAEPVVTEQAQAAKKTIVANTIGTDQSFTGGGQGFTFGSINPTPITTFSQVLDLFPTITASQAADFLAENTGILPERALQQGFDIINITSSPLDPPQIFNQASDPSVSGFTPEQAFKFLFPNIISNF